MNTAISSTGFEEYSSPSRSVSNSLKPIPKIDDSDDIHLFNVSDSMDYLPTHAHLPEKRHAVLDVDYMVVSASLIRRIAQELKNDECDPRTVMNFCRGMERNSREFEDAYIAARIRSHAKHQHNASDPLVIAQANGGSVLQNGYQTIHPPNSARPLHPMAVNHLGHLMSHLGLWAVALLGVQAWASWRSSAFANTYLEGGRIFYFAIMVCLILALDSAVWFRRRGHLCQAFLIPGALLFLMALVPILTLHVRAILLAIR